MMLADENTDDKSIGDRKITGGSVRNNPQQRNSTDNTDAH